MIRAIIGLIRGRGEDGEARRHDRLAWRSGLVFASFLLMFSGVFARCAWLAIAEEADGRAAQERYSTRSVWIPAHRGTIFDARGLVLARDRAHWVIAIDPYAAAGRCSRPSDFDETPEEFEENCRHRVREAFDLVRSIPGFEPLGGAQEIVERLIQDQGANPPRKHRAIGRVDSPRAIDAFLELRRQFHAERWTAFPLPREETVREYPLGSLGLQLVGDLSTRGTALFGVELEYQDALTGTRGMAVSQVDATRRRDYSLGDGREGIRARDGADLELTIELPAQILLEELLLEALEETGARMVTGLILDPRTGAVIAGASFPTCVRGEYASFFPSEEGAEVDDRAFDSLLMAGVFPMEPGSMMKPLVLARALDAGVVNLSTPLEINGERNSVRYGRARRTFTDSHALREKTVEGAVVESSNGGMAQVGARMGTDSLRTLLQDLGFGRVTGGDLQEAPGLRPDQRATPPWNDHTTLSVPIGYEILVTPLQVARAYSAIANGGTLVTPHVVRTVGGIDRSPVPERTRLFSEETTRLVRAVLRRAVDEGTGKDLPGDGILLAGKTGTAAHYDKNGQVPGAYTSSFVGMAPSENPRYVAIVTVDRPDPSLYYASKTAAPVVCELLRALLGDEESRFQSR